MFDTFPSIKKIAEYAIRNDLVHCKATTWCVLLTGEMRLVNDRMKTIKENATFFNPIMDTLLKPTQ